MFERRGRQTVLTHSYAEPPFRVGRVLRLDAAAYVILVCSGPGVFAGDTLRQTLRVGRGAQVVVTSQSALQVHPSPAETPARVVHEYDVESEGELYAHWDPVLPFAAARLDQRFDLRVADDSRLYWSDALMAGRSARGEAWQFSALAHELRLSVGSKIAYLERFRLAPDARSLTRTWAAGAARYLATALIHDRGASEAHAEALHRLIERIPDVRGAVDATEPHVIVSRVAGAAGPAFAEARGRLRRCALELIFGRPNLAGRK